MKNSNIKTTKTQSDFNFGSQPKVFETINCHTCREERELGGFVFKLVGVCDECRTKEDLRILNNRILRRAK